MDGNGKAASGRITAAPAASSSPVVSAASVPKQRVRSTMRMCGSLARTAISLSSMLPLLSSFTQTISTWGDLIESRVGKVMAKNAWIVSTSS